jgi:hypothetical protein
MVTFHVCPHCSKNDGKPRVRVVTFSLRAVSTWHLCWVYWFRKKEFYMEDESGIHYGSVLSSFIFQLRKRGGLEASSEIPPPHKISLPDFPDFSGINFPPPR